jgi:hypothetical protein
VKLRYKAMYGSLTLESVILVARALGGKRHIWRERGIWWLS